MTDLTLARYTDETAAREHLESLRWPAGPFCPHCGSFNSKRLPAVRREAKNGHNATVRGGVVQCGELECRKQYTVTVATVFERSKVPLHKWLLVNHLLVSSKKGISAHQIHRMAGVNYRTAWFMLHRLREAMMANDEPMGGAGGTVEVDETFIGTDPDYKVERTKPGGFRHKMKIVAMIDRETGRSKAVVVDDISVREIRPIVVMNVHRETRLMTDQARHYIPIGKEFASHKSVNHGVGQYVDVTDRTIHTNTIESYFSVFKRGMKGIYQHCAKKHLHRYLAEYDFRYSNRSALGVNDDQRADIALAGIYGKRLMYRRPDWSVAA